VRSFASPSSVAGPKTDPASRILVLAADSSYVYSNSE
jgi:hypothetical protein